MKTILSTNENGTTLMQSESRHRTNYFRLILSNEFVSEPKLQLGVPRLPEVARPYRSKQMSKAAKEKVNHTNPGKKETYLGKQLGASRSEGNLDVNVFQGEDARVTPDTPNESGTRHSQAPRPQGASPHRVRVHPGTSVNHGGSHTKNATKE
jgi:hypothetical protein